MGASKSMAGISNRHASEMAGVAVGDGVDVGIAVSIAVGVGVIWLS